MTRHSLHCRLRRRPRRRHRPRSPARAAGRAVALLLGGLVASTAAASLGAWLWSDRLARADERAHPPVGGFVEVDGVRVHYLRGGRSDAGERPALVFLHGASTSLVDAVPALLPRLARDFDVVAIDRPGHGYSERGDPSPVSGWVDPAVQARRVAGALRALGVRDAVWAGHSWAGSVVLSALLELPAEDVRAGVVLAGAIYPWDTGTAWYAELAAVPVLGAWFAHTLVEPAGRRALDAAVRSTFSPEAVPPDYVERTALVLSLRPDVYRDNAVDLARLSDWLVDVSPRWPAIDRPVLSIAAGADRVVPPVRHAERLEAARPETTSLTLDGAGHGLIQTRAEDIGTAIGEFVRTLPPVR